jgi:ribosomal protein S6--L-glutamate ligase
MRIAFLTRPAQPHSIYPDVCAQLAKCGIGVETISGQSSVVRMNDLAADADLYILRERSFPAFSLALALESAGARFLVPLERERVVRNRFLTQQALAVARIPAPRGWIAGSSDALATIVREEGPVVMKPPDVGAAKGVRILRSPDDVPRELAGPVFAQELVAHTSADIKLFGIGSQVRAVRRPFPALSIEEKLGIEVEPTREMLRLAQQCREAFALPLYGVDLIETGSRLLVVDVNSMPGYKGVPGAAASVAALIRSAALEAA